MSASLPERLAREAMQRTGVEADETETREIAAAIRAALDEAKKAVCPDCAEGFKLDAEGHHVFGALRQESPCPAAAIEALK